jgi:hypothetical protein
MAGIENRIFCTEFNILPLASEFLVSLLSFIVNKMPKFQKNSDIHNIVGYRPVAGQRPRTDEYSCCYAVSG